MENSRTEPSEKTSYIREGFKVVKLELCLIGKLLRNPETRMKGFKSICYLGGGLLLIAGFASSPIQQFREHDIQRIDHGGNQILNDAYKCLLPNQVAYLEKNSTSVRDLINARITNNSEIKSRAFGEVLEYAKKTLLPNDATGLDYYVALAESYNKVEAKYGVNEFPYHDGLAGYITNFWQIDANKEIHILQVKYNNFSPEQKKIIDNVWDKIRYLKEETCRRTGITTISCDKRDEAALLQIAVSAVEKGANEDETLGVVLALQQMLINNKEFIYTIGKDGRATLDNAQKYITILEQQLMERQKQQNQRIIARAVEDALKDKTTITLSKK